MHRIRSRNLNRGVLIKKLLKAGCILKRHGIRHDIYINTDNGKQALMPRHPDVRESLIKLIKKQLDVGVI